MVLPQNNNAFPECDGSFPVSIMVHEIEADTASIIGFRSPKAFSVASASVITEVSSRKEDWLCKVLFEKTCREFQQKNSSEEAKKISAEILNLIQQGEAEAAPSEDGSHTPGM